MASTYTGDVSSKVKLIIHHQCPGIELVSPLYCGDGAVGHLSPEQSIDVGSTTQVDFNVDPIYNMSAFMYKIQRKYIDTSDKEATCIQLFVIWKIDKSGEFYIYSCLIEHDKDLVLNRDGMMKLVEHCELNIQYHLFEVTWLMRDNSVLMTRINITTSEEACYKLEMTIAETSIRDDTRRPWYIDINR
jgi:hypothetical protein